MFRPLVVGAALLCMILPLTASGAAMRVYPVATGGFSLGLPATWVDVATLGSAQLKQFEQVPSFKSFVLQASSNAALRLAVLDPAAKGNVYMDAGAVRVGAVAPAKVVSETTAALKKSLGSKMSAVTTPVRLAAGPAYLLHLSEKGLPNETDEYLFVHDQVEYGLIYVAPKASWARYEPLFTASARTFKLLPGPNLTHLVLTAKQVGSGYRLASYPFGQSIIGEATLDLCAASYPSEILRTGRLQVRYTSAGKGVDVSNEIVTYVPGGANEALAEVTEVASACAKSPAVLKQGALKETYDVSLLKDPRMPPGALAVKIRITLVDGKKHSSQLGIAVYQVKGNTLSGVYTFLAKGTTFADVERIGFHAAQQSADNLGGGSHKSSGGKVFTA